MPTGRPAGEPPCYPRTGLTENQRSTFVPPPQISKNDAFTRCGRGNSAFMLGKTAGSGTPLNVEAFRNQRPGKKSATSRAADSGESEP